MFKNCIQDPEEHSVPPQAGDFTQASTHSDSGWEQTGLLLGWPKSFSFFPYNVSSSAQLSLTSFETILLDCVVTAVISACIYKKLAKIGEFLCSHFNIEDERKYNIFGVLCFVFSRKVKIQLKCKKKICSVYGEGAVTG